MSRMLKLGLAGLMMMAPALLAQARTRPVAPHRAMSAIPPNVFDGEGMSRTGRIVTFALVGGLVGGAIGYYTAPDPQACFTCKDTRQPRAFKGALIGGSIGLTIGAIVTLGGTKPRVELRSATPRVP